jgi:hypothetical protein
MGVSVGRIEKEFILGSIRDKELPVRLHGNKTEVEARIHKFDTGTIQFRAASRTWEQFGEDDRIRVFFSYYGHVMTFETAVREVKDELLLVQYPDVMVKNLERKYERVPPPEDVSAHFVMKGQRIVLDFPKSEEYNPVHRPEVTGELKNESIQSLVNSFQDKVSAIASHNSIKMFRDKKPDTPEERLISRFGRALYIPRTKECSFDLDMVGETKLITRELLKEFLVDEGTEEKNVELRIESILAEKRDRDIYSEIYCPILYREYVTGYIYVYNDGTKRRALSEELLEFIHQFSKILAYSLKMHGYFKGEKPMPTEYSAKIVDISASGMLFAHPSEDLAANLHLYTDFDLTLQFKNRKMIVPSRIMRRFEESAMYYFGVLFLEMKPEDFRYLFDLIYGKEYKEDEDETWEGGAAPPAINLFEDSTQA